jgi:serine/threonine protein kinase
VGSDLALGRLGRYELIQEIGHGTSSIVYQARDPHLDRVVAVKVVELPQPVSSAERRAFDEVFFEEARRAGRLSHPGIVLVHDAARDGESDSLFVVFEYVEGETLACQLAAGRSFDWRQALRLVRQLAEALLHAHAHGVVHRDLRPANIMLLPSGDAKILDFGVARLESARMSLNSIEQPLGAPPYMSPEQAVGEISDARTDLFSLGAVAYRLLTGQDAFASDDPRGVLGRVVYEMPSPPSHLAPDLPPGIDELIAHALAKSRKDRYPDAKQFVEDLDDLMASRVPRHSGPRALPNDTQPFREALQASLLAANANGPTPDLLPAAEQTRLPRRTLVRIGAGLLALLVVGGFDLRRRVNEAGAAGDASAAAPPATATAPLIAASNDAPMPDSGLPSVVLTPPPSRSGAAAAPARLVVELNHTLSRGTLVVTVDDAKVLQERIAAPPARSILGVKLREGHARRVVEVTPGRHRIGVHVAWDDERRSRTVVGTLRSGSTRRAVATLSRLTKNLSMQWR